MRARHLVCFLIALLVSLVPAGQVLARTIGVVFDDSGSMNTRIHLPAFGVQLLISTLDGRAGHDRLFSIRLSEQKVTPIELRTADEIGRAIDTIRQVWTNNPTSDTPYRPIDLMLDKLIQETAPDEEAYLLVVTDGGFNRGLLNPQQLRASYETYKRRMRGRLQVMWLFLDPTGDLQRAAEQQQVYSTMVDVFGGDQGKDVKFVRNENQLQDALVYFVSKISSTDLDRTNTVMRRAGNAIDLDLPFSITRIISIGVGSNRSRLPVLQQPGFPAERLPFSPSMAKPDIEYPTRLFGEVTQLRMEPALGTGNHRLEFSGPVGDETVLLFRSEIGLTWKLMDGDKEIRAGPGGLIEPSLGHKYKIVAQVQDRVAGAGVVPPSRIPKAEVSVTVIDPAGHATPLILTSSDKDQGFIADHVFTTEGKYQISAALRLPGFVTSRSDAVSVNVVPRALGLALRLGRLEACPSGGSCPDDVVPVKVQPAPAPAGTVGSVEVTGTPPRGRSGQFRLEVKNLPDGFQLVGPNGRPVRPDSAYDVGAGGTVHFNIVRPAGWRPSFGAAPVQTTVKAVAVQPLEGEASLAFHVAPNMPNPVLSYRGHDQDPQGKRPLSLDLATANQAHQGFDFAIENALDLPTQRNLSVSFGSGVVGFFGKADIRLPPSGALASGYAFSVHPRVSWWCQCVLGLALWAGLSPDTLVTVSYDPRDGRPPVSAQAPLQLSAAAWSPLRLWSGCLWLVLLALCIAYVLRVIYALLAAHRFPVMSRFYTFDVDHIQPMIRKVRNSFWSDFRSALMLRIPRHRYRLDSLVVEADGAQLRLRTLAYDWPSYYSARHGNLLQIVAEQMVKRDPKLKRASDAIIPMAWDRLLEDQVPGGRRIVFVRDFRRPPEPARERVLVA